MQAHSPLGPSSVRHVEFALAAATTAPQCAPHVSCPRGRSLTSRAAALPLRTCRSLPTFPLSAAGTLFQTMFPQFPIYSVAADSVFYVPVWRHVIAWIGSLPASRDNFKRLLRKGSVAVVVGGIAEMFMQGGCPGPMSGPAPLAPRLFWASLLLETELIQECISPSAQLARGRGPACPAALDAPSALQTPPILLPCPALRCAAHMVPDAKRERIKMKGRKGFCRIALQEGIDGIVPVFYMGHSQVRREPLPSSVHLFFHLSVFAPPALYQSPSFFLLPHLIVLLPSLPLPPAVHPRCSVLAPPGCRASAASCAPAWASCMAGGDCPSPGPTPWKWSPASQSRCPRWTQTTPSLNPRHVKRHMKAFACCLAQRYPDAHSLSPMLIAGRSFPGCIIQHFSVVWVGSPTGCTCAGRLLC